MTSQQIWAVRFHGSSTYVNTINHWIETGEIKMPTVVTCDIRPSFTTKIGNMKVNLGDYVVKDAESGIFKVMTPEEFDELYNTEAPL